MGDALAAIVAAYQAARGKDWRMIRQVPLVHGVEALTRVGTPFALAPAEAGVVRDAVDAFVRRFPGEYDQIRLCALDYGLNAIIGALATLEAPLPNAAEAEGRPMADSPVALGRDALPCYKERSPAHGL